MEKIELKIIEQVSSNIAWDYNVVPYKFIDENLYLFTNEIEKSKKIQKDLGVLLGYKINLEAKSDNAIDILLQRYYPEGKTKRNINRVNLDGDFLNKILQESVNLRSSDIHIEIFEEECRIRYRVDGKLIERYKVDRYKYPALINKIKIKSNLDISEKRLPQDGRIKFKTEKEDIDIRVSVLPTMQGEKIVLRLLNKDTANLGIERLGMQRSQVELYRKMIHKPYGIILISGPTGSGKTTSLYSSLKELNSPELNILTIEDPIEYTLNGINQVQVHESIGLTYAEALKTFLRQDPDIIMLGEIRDVETAEMATRAALTGHLVFSTIHTNTAWGTISRLMDMGIPPYLLTSTLILSVAQRLVRTLCPHCKKRIKLGEGDSSLESHLKGVEEYAIAEGCSDCFYTGYKGRKAVYELIEIDERVKDLIKNNTDIRTSPVSKNIDYLEDGVMRMIKQLETSPYEVLGFINN